MMIGAVTMSWHRVDLRTCSVQAGSVSEIERSYLQKIDFLVRLGLNIIDKVQEYSSLYYEMKIVSFKI